MKLRLFLLFTLFISVFNNSLIARSEPVKQKLFFPKPSIQTIIQMSLRLTYTDDQKTKIKEIIEKRMSETDKLQAKAIKAMDNYLSLVLERKATKPLIYKKNKEVEQAYEILRTYQLETWLQIKAHLTEDQLDELIQQQDKIMEQTQKARLKLSEK